MVVFGGRVVSVVAPGRLRQVSEPQQGSDARFPQNGKMGVIAHTTSPALTIGTAALTTPGRSSPKEMAHLSRRMRGSDRASCVASGVVSV